MSQFDLEDFLPYQLNVASARVSRAFAERYKAEFGISIPEWRVLAHLSAAGAPVSVREVQARVDMDKSKVSRAASRLEAAGHIIKAENAQDRRLIGLTLTAQGESLMARIIPMALGFQQEILAQLGQDSDALRRALGQLQKGVSDED